MLLSHEYTTNGLTGNFLTLVRETEDLPNTLQFWMAHVARDLLRLGVYFRAAALMYQIPGGTHYQWIRHDNVDPNLPNDDDDPLKWVRDTDRNTVLNVLHECLRRVGGEGVMKRIPGGHNHKRKELSKEWKAYLARRAKDKYGLLNVVAECLDELVVRPGMAEIDVKPRATWYERWWARMEE